MSAALQRVKAWLDDPDAFNNLPERDLRAVVAMAEKGLLREHVLELFRAELDKFGVMPCSCLPYVKSRLDGMLTPKRGKGRRR